MTARTSTAFVALARIVRPQGRRGELAAEILTDFPQRFATLKTVSLEPPSGSAQAMRPAILENHWLHKGRVVFKFAGVDSISAAEELRGFAVTIPREHRMPLEDGAVYISDLVGSELFDLRGSGYERIGEVAEVIPEGVGPAILVVRSPSAEDFLIPFAKAYLRNVDLEAGRIEMDLPQGLLTIDAPLTAEERQRMGEEEPRE